MKSSKAIVSTVCVLAALLVTATAAIARGTHRTGARAGVTLTVWDWSSPPPASMKELDDAFMKQNPDIVIKRVHQPFNSYFTLLRTAVATRKGPDVFEGYATSASCSTTTTGLTAARPSTARRSRRRTCSAGAT